MAEKLETFTIDAADQVFSVSCVGTASAVISVSGTFTGIVRVDGASSGNGILGGRLLFKSGVGSIGGNTFEGTGVAFDREFRIVTGGERVVFTVESWSSGSANVEFLATKEASTVFVNGPVHDAEEEAVRNERGFVADTGVLAVTAGNVLITTLSNPSDSGVNIFLTNRTFANDQNATATPLEFIGYANPTYVPTTIATSVNRRAGGPTSAAVARNQVRALSGLTVGGTQGVSTILPNRTPYNLAFDFIIPPAASLGLLIQGAGNNIGNAARISIGLRWYEELVN